MNPTETSKPIEERKQPDPKPDKIEESQGRRVLAE